MQMRWLLAVGAMLAFIGKQAHADSLPQPDFSAAPLVTSEAGPWMICAASYTGPESQELARLVAMHLRTQHGFASYLYSRSSEERRQIEQQLMEMQQAYPEAQRRRRTVRIEEQWAVLIGGFNDMDTATAAVARVKQLPMPNLQLSSGKPAFDSYDYPVVGEGKTKPEMKRVQINPFQNSFVIRNPVTPGPTREFKPDPVWKKFNSGEEYSLLKCPGKFTLLIKDYQGAAVIQTGTSQGSGNSFLDKIGLGSNRPGDALDAAARQAHEIARVLRQLGFESYVLHTRGGSLITVGSFGAENDPELQRVKDRLGRFSLGPTVQLYARPILMPVPKF